MSDKPFRTGKTAAKKAAKAQEESIAKQQQSEELRLAEESDVSGRRKALAKSGQAGRSLLINTGSGKANNLGGTT